VGDHLDDLASDFSVYHRIRDISKLPGPVFFAMAHRIGAYGGVMALRGHERQQEAPQSQQAPRTASAPQMRRVPLPPPGSRQAIAADPVLSRIFSFG
jgi:hypothetical protein